MKKREIVIVALAVIAVLYWALDFFVLSGRMTSKRAAPPGKQTAAVAPSMTDASAAAAQFAAQLAMVSAKDSPRAGYLIERAEAPWTSDPFADVDLAEVDTDADTAISDMDLIYSGYLMAGKRIFAVINGMEYKTGDILMDYEVTVSSITPARVVLLDKAENEIIIPIEEN